MFGPVNNLEYCHCQNLLYVLFLCIYIYMCNINRFNEPLGATPFYLSQIRQSETSLHDCLCNRPCKLDFYSTTSKLIKQSRCLHLVTLTKQVWILWEVPEASLPFILHTAIYDIITRCIIAHNLSPPPSVNSCLLQVLGVT